MHFENNKHHVIHKSIHDRMNKIYFFQAFTTFAKSLIGIFVPIYLYKLGYSAIELIMYAIGICLINLIMFPVAIKLLKKIGFKFTLLLSIPIYLAHITIINFVPNSNLYFHLGWITFGLYAVVFWPAFHSEIAANGSKKHRTNEIGTLQIIITLFGTIAPMIGGILLDAKNYLYLLIFASTILLIGMIPLLLAKDIKLKHYNFGYKDYLRIIKSKKYKITKKIFTYDGFNNIIVITIWPIILFTLLNQSFARYGTLMAILSFISIIVMLYLKKYFEKKSKEKYLKHTGKVLSFNWILKSVVFLIGLPFLYFVESIYKLTDNVFKMLFNSIYYNNAKNTDHMEYILVGEIYFRAAKILFGIFVIGILLIFGESIQTFSAIAFTGVFTSLGLSYFKEENI